MKYLDDRKYIINEKGFENGHSFVVIILLE